jgi:hypothetical protein
MNLRLVHCRLLHCSDNWGALSVNGQMTKSKIIHRSFLFQLLFDQFRPVPAGEQHGAEGRTHARGAVHGRYG